MDRAARWATVHGSQRVGHNRSDLACMQAGTDFKGDEVLRSLFPTQKSCISILSKQSLTAYKKSRSLGVWDCQIHTIEYKVDFKKIKQEPKV